ncbi:hypothetical protein FGRMN_5262 [Fusarium graminum]|nr:hypothetical protein FGRMN_5262 [Fusarium graminum]
MKRNHVPSKQHDKYSSYNYLESQDSLEMRHRPQHHSSPPLLHSQTEVSSVSDSSITVGTSAPARRRRIGIGTWVIIAISFLVLTASLTFLSWLWFVDRGNEFWRYLVLSGKSTQSITIMGVLIRWAIGSLATIATSMAASIAVERFGIPKSALAEVSIARFTNNGPGSLKKLLPGTSFQGCVRVLLSILALLVAVSQFSSTLLVADLQPFQLSSFSQSISYAFALKPSESSSLSHPDMKSHMEHRYWTKRPGQFEIFAEYSEPGRIAESIDDTGPTLRALLPIGSQTQRERMHSFTGLSRIIDNRVVCHRPTIVNARFNWQDDKEFPLYIDINVTAKMDVTPDLYNVQLYKSFVEENGYRDDKFRGRFTCPLPEDRSDIPRSNWLLCKGGSESGSFSLISPLGNITETHIYREEPQLLINISPDRGYGLTSAMLGGASWDHINSSSSGPWLRQWSRAKRGDKRMTPEWHNQLTVCFNAINPSTATHFNITASTAFNHTEPRIQYYRDTDVYDTLTIRNQLNAISDKEKEAVSSREILTISKEDWNDSMNKRTGNPDGYGSTWMDDFISYSCLAICPTCPMYLKQWEATSDPLWNIFNDVLNSTDSPALAVQALSFMVIRMLYYDYFPLYTDAPEPASITTLEVARAPQQYWGLVAVIAIVIGNALIFLIVLFLFLRTTDSSFLDNAWHTIAQISQSEDVKPLLERAKLASDKDIDDWLHDREPAKGTMASVKEFLGDVSQSLFIINNDFLGHSPFPIMSTPQYAKDQPVGFSNHIEKVAIVGAGGRQGAHMTEQLVKTGKHTITALTRHDSTSQLPEGINISKVNYEDGESIASALEGQQLLIITLANGVDAEVHHRIVRAAGKAGVRHIVPNIYAANIVAENKGAVDDFFPASGLRDLLTEIERVGVSSWTVLVGSVWFDYSFPAGPFFMGFDLNNRQVTLFDEGEAKINTSTWAQYGRGAAALASLKVLPEDENDISPTLAQFRNKPLYLSSFYVSQKDILASVQRVTNTTDADWDIKYESTGDRMDKGKAQAASGDFRGLVQPYYSFIFSPEGQKLNYQAKLHNKVLGLPEEDLDEVVKECVEKAKNGYSPF